MLGSLPGGGRFVPWCFGSSTRRVPSGILFEKPGEFQLLLQCQPGKLFLQSGKLFTRHFPYLQPSHQADSSTGLRPITFRPGMYDTFSVPPLSAGNYTPVRAYGFKKSAIFGR
jgi:hypothetical protein